MTLRPDETAPQQEDRLPAIPPERPTPAAEGDVVIFVRAGEVQQHAAEVLVPAPAADAPRLPELPHTNRIHAVDTSDGVTVVTFEDRSILDACTIQEMGDELFSLVESFGRTRFVIDLQTVHFLSSAAINKLIVFDKKAKARGPAPIFCNIDPEIMEVFEITRINKIFAIREKRADAEAALKGKFGRDPASIAPRREFWRE